MLTLGIDTSNYATSLAVFDTDAGEVVCDCKKFLPVKEGQLGLRQSDALFHHTAALPAMLAELGASFVKTYYCDHFEKVVAACPVPVVIAGGKKLPELEALEMAYRAIFDGAHGVDMGRNIFQSDCPAGMAQAIGKVVHEGYTAQQAYEVYQEVKNAR